MSDNRMLVDGFDWTDSRIIASQRARIAELEGEVTRLRGRIVPDGYVAVPERDIRLALRRSGTIDGLNALRRLRSLVPDPEGD